MAQYIHQGEGTEIQSITGHYTVLEEGQLKQGDRPFLYVMGAAVVDSSCCGTGGGRFLNVPGYILSWKQNETIDGFAISEVEPVVNEEDRKAIKAILDRKFPNSQVNFF
ncbi:MAG: hypothetical protein JW950_02380 [Deltaproteobacteria bacterium]|nr:hypothetical protein [Deltaproteobacteria bacterium]